MNAPKIMLVIVVVVGASARTASAQQGNAPAGGYPTYPGIGTNGDYYSITNSYGNYGLPGVHPKYQGYGLSGYGPGSILNEYFVPWPGPGVKPVANPVPAKPTPTVSMTKKSPGERGRTVPRPAATVKPRGK